MPPGVDAAPEVPLLIKAEKRSMPVNRHHPVFNPSTGAVIARTPLNGPEAVDAAVQAAQEAFRDWSVMAATKRVQVLFKYKELLERDFERLAKGITEENGKTLEEARGDLRRGIEVVEFACGVAHLTKGESMPRVAEGLDALTMREPIGVCAGITPFNFPAMVPMWMFPMAIACGNAFVLKPSEKVPLTALRLAELFSEAGLPPGVLNVVPGGQEAVEALCTHPGIVAISFVGSTGVANYVYETACRHKKRVQAAGGAKNVLLVLPDADLDSATKAILGSAYGCAGQRCMAGSLLMTLGKAGDGVIERLAIGIDGLTVDDTGTNAHAQMGPVIDRAAKDRVVDTVRSAVQISGVQPIRDGTGKVPARGFFLRPALLDGITPAMNVFKQEVFGPVLSVVRPADLDQAIEWMQTLGFGNGASIFTRDGDAARKFSHQMPCGMIGVNVGVPAPMAPFAFSGWNDSFYGDLHVQGIEGVMFYTRQRVVLSRWGGTHERKSGW